MGVTAALAPAPKQPALGAVAPVLEVANRMPELAPRSCECGAGAALSGRCESCDRTSLSPRGVTAGHPGPASLGPKTAIVPSPLVLTSGPPPTNLTATLAGRASHRSEAAVPPAVTLISQAPTIRRSAPVGTQTSLRVSSPGDAAEVEAQSVGSHIARMVEPARAVPVQHTEQGPTVFRQTAGHPALHPDTHAKLTGGQSGGAPLPPGVRLFMEPRFGADFSDVRIHLGDDAASLCGQLGARAFTVGREIYFAKDQFAPDTPSGRELIAHELTHTIQQHGAAPRPPSAAATAAPVRPAPSAPAANVTPPATRVATPPLAPAAPSARPVIAPPARLAPPPPARVASPAAPRAPAPAAVRAAATPAPAIAARAPVSVQRFGLSDAWSYFADKANVIPGFRMLTIVLGVNPLTMAPVDRSAANVLRAIIEFVPGGGLIVQALDNSGIFDKAGAWASDQLATLKMTGAALRDAANTFLGTLSWSDVLHLGDVWDRAKKIFSDPIDKLIAFVKNLAIGFLKLIKDAILLPLAKLAEGTRGWDLLIAVLGKNPITGAPVPQTAETLIGGFLKLIGQDEIWDNMKKSNAIGRAWTWFKNAMAAVVGFVSQIPELFIAAFKSLTIEDVVLVVGAFQKVASVFGGFLAKFADWAGTAIWNLLEIIFDVVSPGALAYIKKTGAALKSILKNPLPFVGNLVKAAKLGFTNFAAHFGEHLKAGIIDWLTGSLPGVYIPKALTLVEFGKFALSVLGITWAQIRGKIVKALGPNGEKIMTALETAFDIVVALVKGGPAAAWELIKEKLSDLKDTVISGLTSFVVDTIVQKAVPKLISLFIPGAGFISAILSIYDTVMVFVQKLAKIAAAVKAFVDSIVAIAAGQIEGAANKVESTLAGLLSLAINFLAGFLGLSGIAGKVMAVVTKVRATVDKAIDTAITWIITKAKALFAKLFSKSKGKDSQDRLDSTAPQSIQFKLGDESHTVSARVAGGEVQLEMASSVTGQMDVVLGRLNMLCVKALNEQKAALAANPTRAAKIRAEADRLDYLITVTRKNYVGPGSIYQLINNIAGGVIVPYADMSPAQRKAAAENELRKFIVEKSASLAADAKLGFTALEAFKYKSGYVDEGGWLLPQYHDVRRYFYKVSWGSANAAFKSSRMADLRKKALQSNSALSSQANKNNYYWSEDVSKESKMSPYIADSTDPEHAPQLDHIDPLGQRWIASGKPQPGNNTTQANRDVDYRDPTNLQVISAKMNQSKGGNDFLPQVEAGFRGPADPD